MLYTSFMLWSCEIISHFINWPSSIYNYDEVLSLKSWFGNEKWSWGYKDGWRIELFIDEVLSLKSWSGNEKYEKWSWWYKDG